MTMILHELRQNIKTLFIWTAAIAGMIFIFMMIYPQMGDQVSEMEDVFANLGGFSAAFGMDKISFTTALGFYGVEAAATIAIGGGMLAALLGGSILSKEEGSHTAEFLFTNPVRRESIILQKLVAVIILVATFNIVCTLSGIGAFAAMKEDLELKKFLMFHGAQLLMQLEVACICFGISAFLKKTSMGLAIGISMLLYFLQMFVNVSDKMEWLKYITPYYYADAANIFSNSKVEWGMVALGMGYALVAVCMALWKYGRKDLAA